MRSDGATQCLLRVCDSVPALLCIVRTHHLPQQRFPPSTRVGRQDRQHPPTGILGTTRHCPELEFCHVLCPSRDVGKCRGIAALLGIRQRSYDGRRSQKVLYVWRLSFRFLVHNITVWPTSILLLLQQPHNLLTVFHHPNSFTLLYSIVLHCIALHSLVQTRCLGLVPTLPSSSLDSTLKSFQRCARVLAPVSILGACPSGI